MKVQLVVTEESSSRIWDTIRSSKEAAFMQIADYMKPDKDMHIVAVANLIAGCVLDSGDVEALMVRQGFSVTIRYY